MILIGLRVTPCAPRAAPRISNNPPCSWRAAAPVKTSETSFATAGNHNQNAPVGRRGAHGVTRPTTRRPALTVVTSPVGPVFHALQRHPATAVFSIFHPPSSPRFPLCALASLRDAAPAAAQMAGLGRAKGLNLNPV